MSKSEEAPAPAPAVASGTVDDGAQAVLSRYLEGGSITPSTHHEIRDMGAGIYRSQYGYGDTIAVHFGIKADEVTLESDAVGSAAEGDITGNNTGAGAGCAVGGVTGASVGAVASVASSDRSGGSKGTKAQKAIADRIMHEKVESIAMQQAVQYLLQDSAPPAALVDILAREYGKVKAPEGGSYEVHTVVLYRNPANTDGTHDVTVIDPSNFLFSLHLSNRYMVESMDHSNLGKIVTIAKSKPQIYKPMGEIGPNSEQFRDCVDIAVKLAFGLSAQSEPQAICTIDDIKTHPVIQRVSNNSKLDADWRWSKNAARIKQASSVDVEEAFCRTTKTMSKLLKACDTMDVDSDSLKVAYKNAVVTPVPHTAYVDQLGELCGIANQANEGLTKMASECCTELVTQLEALGKVESEAHHE